MSKLRGLIARSRDRWRSGPGRKAALALVVAVAALASITLLRASDPWFLADIRERTFDAYQRLQPRAYQDFPVRIVDIDEASLSAFGQWPWPRTRLAALVTRLNELGASVIAFDVLFAEPDRTSPQRLANDLPAGDSGDTASFRALLERLPDNDRVFADAIEQAPVVAAFAPIPQKNERRPPTKAGLSFVGANPTNILHPFLGAATNIPIIDAAAKGIGSVTVSKLDKAGIVRRVPMLFSDGAKVYPTLAVEALRVALGQRSFTTRATGASGELQGGLPALVGMRIGPLQLPLTAEGEMWVHYDHDRPQRYVSVKDVLDPAKDAEVRPRIADQLVFVGTSAIGLLDSRTTALGELVPGVSIHAQIAEQILSQSFLSRPDWADGVETTATVLLGLLLTALLLGLGPRYALAAAIVVIGAGIGASWLAYSHLHLLLDPLYPSLGALAVYFAVLGLLYLMTDKERKFVRQAFGQYLAPELLAQLERSPDRMRLGGEMRHVSIMFMDVREFTPIAEALSAQELVTFINKLLSPLTDAIQADLGTIDKYVGDAIMAFWNAPLDIKDHAKLACRAALRMRAIVAHLNAEDAFGFRARELRQPDVHIRIGINTGEACVGNMGSEKRFNYSALGDAVNVAARIEATCKTFGLDILVSEDTAREAQDFAMLEASAVSLKGKSRATKLFALVGDPEWAAGAEFQALASAHHGLIAAVTAREAAAATAALVACRALAPPDLAAFYRWFEDHIASFARPPVALAAE